MVFRRALALLCIAAAVTLADASIHVESPAHHGKHHAAAVAAKETKVEYPNGVVLTSTSADEGKAHHKKKKAPAAAAADSADESSDDKPAKKHKKEHHHKKHQQHASKKEVKESTAANGEVTRAYAYGSVRMFKGDSAHKKAHAKAPAGDVTKDFELKEGVNEFEVEGVPLKVTVDHGRVDVSVNGQHVEAGADVVVDTAEKPAAHKAHKARGAHKVPAKKAAPTEPEAAKQAPEAAKAEAADAQAARVTELATKLSSDSRGFFSTETAPVVFVCGIVGALAAVVGIAAVAVQRARAQAPEPGSLQSVLSADAAEADLEAAAQDAPADTTDSLEDSESDNDDDDGDDDAGEGTFANNEHAGVVAV